MLVVDRRIYTIENKRTRVLHARGIKLCNEVMHRDN